jgi:chromosome segregation protein
MYLKSLELFGFKSFAQKTTLNFHPGVTAIVGPNGCGKSNVLDAMRWVLGEQSAKALRGGEMADVIFSGTDSRVALGMAEVSLNFADCEKDLGVEWNEVCITRRVFRDGNSEYLLNKTPCRLRDIHNLFMDTGIGRSAYSIMEQGKIDLILSSKPEDRRAIFEEAAGITKFKSQKKEALRKLDATEANLLRLSDIIKEVKRQIGSLQRQAGKARRYQTLISDLKVLETHLSRHQFDTLDASLAQSLGEIERLRKTQDQHSEEIESQEADVAAQRRGFDEMENNLNAARQVVQDLKNQVSNAENRIGFNRERIAEFNSLMERYQFDIAAAEEKLRVQETQIQNTDLEIEQIAGTLQFEEQRLEEKMSAVGAARAQRAETESELQSTSAAITKIENRLSSLRGEISSIINVRDGSETRIGILESEIQQLAGSLERVNLQNADVRAQVEQGVAALAEKQEQARLTDEQVRSIQGELGQVDLNLNAEQRILAERESKLEVLRQLNEEGEGFAEGTQAVLRGLDNPDFFKPAVLGALASHIEVEPQFVIAIEAALGQNLQAIVMKDTMIAEAVIKTLSSQKLGRVSLALRDFKMRDADHTEGNGFMPDGALAWAVDRVKTTSAEIAGLVTALLRGCVIVPDLEAALRIVNTPHAAFRVPQSFVTLTGEVLSAEGILQGGQVGEAGSSVLVRKNQITQLEAEAGVAREKITGLSAQRAEVASQLEAVQAALAEAREEAQRINLSVSTLRGQLSLLDRELHETTGKQENLRWELGNVQARHSEAIEKLQGLENDLAGVGANQGELQARQGELQGLLESHRSSEAELNSELNELRIKVATEKQRHNSLNNQRQPMTARLQELHDLIEQRRGEIESYRVKSESFAEESTNIQAGIEVARAEMSEGEAGVSRLLEERAAMTAAIESLESTLRIMRRQLSECHDQRSQHEVKQTQIQLRIENLADHVSRRYQIDIRDFQPDSYALLCTIREQSRKQKKAAETPENGAEIQDENAAAQPEAAPETPVAEEAGEAAEAVAEIAPEAVQEGQRIDWELVESLVREFDQRLESMGPINLEAIQEYDELEQRYNFLEQQNTDLNNSKAELLDVISKINETTRKLFADTFEQVRVNFAEMFVELFGGGKANLVLSDESDPLESGIDIIAKPPGKQLQSISLLSGGEKTMTAVALLFSIYMVKPSPFCVLDEMDAPLDESNINRFIKILDRFVAQSQFVVITHNKRTIAKADVLYGVTMEEHGVSKLVGVKFSKRESSGEQTDITGTSNPSPVPSVAESFGKSGDLHSETAAG